MVSIGFQTLDPIAVDSDRHRPYLSLYEQVLYSIVQDIASKFTGLNNTKYVAAAKDFRMPYYDWAALPSEFPSALTASRVNVVDQNGPRQMNNPLASFKFHPVNPAAGDFDAYWSRFLATNRYPDSNGNSRNSQVTAAISTMAAALRKSVVIALAFQNYNAFSNNRWLQNQQAGQYGSLENMHDNLHGALGGNGHMSSLEVSAFDPVFWLHHCNVDRLWAIWGALNPNSFVEPGPTDRDSFTAKRGTIEDVNTQLKPFWDGSGTKFWNSIGVKETVTFNYAYPETQKWKFNNVADYQRSVKSTVAQLYGTGNVVRDFITSGAINSVPSARLFATQKAVAQTGASSQSTSHEVASSGHEQAPTIQVDSEIGPDGMYHLISSKHNLSIQSSTNDQSPQPPHKHLQNSIPFQNPQPSNPTTRKNTLLTKNPAKPLPPLLQKISSQKTYTEYITNIRASKHGLHQTFTVYLFLGDFNPSPSTWPFEYNTVGRFTVLGRASTTACKKCADDAAEGLVVTGTVPLTSALLQDIVSGGLGGLEVEEVVPHLVKDLHWRVVGFDGVEILREQVPGLKVAVCSTLVGVGVDDVPVYDGEWVTHTEVSDGRPGGLGRGDLV